MNRLRAWLDPSGFRAALVLGVALALANGAWILLDHTSPSWDQAHYLNVTWQYKQALATGGVGGLIDSIHSIDPGHGPLFTTALLPFFYVLDDLTRSGMVLNLILAPILYLSAGQIAMHLFGDWRARLLTILMVATMPVMVGLYHNVLQDFPLTVIATASLLLMLKTDRFQHRGMSGALGAVLGLGTLTKVTFPAGGALILAGFVLSLVALLIWGGTGFDELDYRDTLRIVIPAATTLMVGVQTVLASFFLSILGIEHAHDRHG